MPFAERHDLLTILPRLYAKLAEAWGGEGLQVHTVKELRLALLEADQTSSFVGIETMVPPHDLSPVTEKYSNALVGNSQ